MKKILLILFVVLTYSCGAKKSESKKEEVIINTETNIDSASKIITDTKKEELSNVKTEERIITTDRGEVTTKETTYELSDITKPGRVTTPDGVFVLDNVKKTTKETTQKKNTQTEGVVKKDSIGTVNTDIKKTDEVKTNVNQKDNSSSITTADSSDRKQYNFFKSLWFIIPIVVIALVILVYLFYRKYRNKLPI